MTERSQDHQILWYVGRSADGGELFGPYTADEVLARLSEGKIGWIDGIWNENLGKEWRRVLEIPLFRTHLPPLPSKTLIPSFSSPEIRPAEPGAVKAPNFQPPKEPDTRSTGTARIEPGGKAWYLQFQGSEFGPLSLQEVCNILKRGKLQGHLMGWTEGLPDWRPLGDFSEFKDFYQPGGLPIGRLEKRHSNRKTLIATVQFSRMRGNERSPNIYTGICRDISETGMRVTTSSIPRAKGMVLRLDIEPMNVNLIPPFTVDGEVMRILDDHGFAVRFTNLSIEIKNLIQLFIDTEGDMIKTPGVEAVSEPRKKK